MGRVGRVAFKAWMKIHDLRRSEAGQDLVEYSLLVAMIALAAIAGVKHVATAVNSVFSNISNSLG